MIITATAPIAGDPRTYWSCSCVTLHRVGMYRRMILAASGVLNDRPATTKHEVTRNPAARGNALNYPQIDVRGMMLVDRGQAAEFRSAPTPRKSLSLPGVLRPPILADWTALVQRARRRYRSPQPAILQPTIDRTGR